MVWMLPTRAMPLEFALFLSKGLFTPKLHAKVTLDLMAADAGERVLTFGIYDGIPCELRVDLRIRTLEIPRPSRGPFGQILPRTRLILNDTTFYPGANITGLVTMSLQAPLTVEELFIGVHGFSFSSFKVGPAHLHQKQRTIPPVLTAATHINRTATLAGITKKDYTPVAPTTLSPGFYSWMFEFTLPMDLPPSSGPASRQDNTGLNYTPEGSTQYSVSLCSRRESCADSWFAARAGTTIDFGAMEATELAKQSIKILPSPFICPPQTHMATSPTTTHLGSLSITGQATMLTGSRYELKIAMDNKSQQPVVGITAELERLKVLQAHCPPGPHYLTLTPKLREYMQTEKMVVQSWNIGTGLPLAPGAQSELTFPLDVNSGYEPTVHSQLNPTFQVQHRLRVTARYQKSGTTVVELPVYLSLPMPTDTPIPAEPLGTPGELIVLPNPPQELVDTALGSTKLWDGSTSFIPIHGATLPTDLAHNPNIIKPTGITSVHVREIPAPLWKCGQTFDSIPTETAHPDLSHAFLVHPLGFRAPAP